MTLASIYAFIISTTLTFLSFVIKDKIISEVYFCSGMVCTVVSVVAAAIKGEFDKLNDKKNNTQ